MADSKQVDQIVNEETQRFHSWLGFLLRDKTGDWPLVLRTLVRTREGEGTHVVEVETKIQLSPELEESYEKTVRDMAIREATKVLVDGD